MREIGVAVAGLGNVGRETVRLLLTHRADFSRRLGAELVLRAVCDRDAANEARRLRVPAKTLRVKDYKKLAQVPNVDIVVELFGGLEHARGLVLGALESGRHVVTANKLLLATRWDEIWKASRDSGRRVFFEAAVAGGIPILQALRQGLAANEISSVMGIFNGTTNHILTEMVHTGCEMESALKEAQRLGMAEKDPTLDLNGTDTAQKVSIVASLLAGSWVDPARIHRQGIEGLDAEDIRFAVQELEKTVRLIGTVRVDWSKGRPRIEAHVQPTLIGFKHPLAAVHGGYNAVLVSASSAEDLMFYGKGAGPGPSASAVLGDLLMLSQEILARGEAAPSAAETGRPAPQLLPESPAPFYLKLRVRDVPGALARIAGALGRFGVSIAQVQQHAPEFGRGGNLVSVMIATHATTREALEKARRAIVAMPMVSRRHTCLRFLPS